MGFSLKIFFQDLQDILDDPFLKEYEKINLIQDLVRKEKQYARECGQLL